MKHTALYVIFQPKVFTLIPIRLPDTTAKLQETQLQGSSKTNLEAGCSTAAALLSPASQCQLGERQILGDLGH